LRPAATDAAPAPSATIAERATRSLIAASTSGSGDTREPARSRFTGGHISSSTAFPPMPSTNVGVRSTSTGRPAAIEAASGAAVSTSQPKTCTSGREARIAAAIPQLSPPPPKGTSTALTSGASSRISRPMVPLPAIMPTSLTGWMKRAGSSSAKR